VAKALRQIQLVDWQRAIYIDFESRMKDPESLLGHACEGTWSVYIIEPELWSAASHGHAKGQIIAETVQEALRAIRTRAEAEQRIIAAWSSREHEGISHTLQLSESERQWWADNLVDAKKYAKPMARQLNLVIRQRKSSIGKGMNKHSLASYMEAVGYKVPAMHGPNNAAQRILYVRRQILAKGSFDAITPTAKKKWANGLSHNYHDCIGLEYVMTRLATRAEHQSLRKQPR
jgi:hypothetical protein